MSNRVACFDCAYSTCHGAFRSSHTDSAGSYLCNSNPLINSNPIFGETLAKSFCQAKNAGGTCEEFEPISFVSRIYRSLKRTL